MAELEYRQLTPSDVEQAAQVIAQSFVDDPLTSFMLPIKTNRIKTLYKFFRLYGEINIQNRRGYGVGDPLQGVAFWKFPDQGNISISVKSLGKFLPLFLTSYPIGYLRAKPILNQIETLHNKYAVGLHFYLDNLAVLPSARGQGLSSRLIRPFLEMADAQNVIAYTDTVTETNVPLYEHFGFQCVAATPVNGTGITVYALRRPAM
ncbi:MAG TPA: GNAT family N-acetyltransferase [Anaerolineales bacterium]|nr:GNAT family N-acetyltransferase [Anaerolineales bacterium]